MSSDEVVVVVGVSDGSGWYWDMVVLCFVNVGVWWRGGGRDGVDCGFRFLVFRVWGFVLSVRSGFGYFSLFDFWVGFRFWGFVFILESRGSG